MKKLNSLLVAGTMLASASASAVEIGVAIGTGDPKIAVGTLMTTTTTYFTISPLVALIMLANGEIAPDNQDAVALLAEQSRVIAQGGEIPDSENIVSFYAEQLGVSDEALVDAVSRVDGEMTLENIKAKL